MMMIKKNEKKQQATSNRQQEQKKLNKMEYLFGDGSTECNKSNEI